MRRALQGVLVVVMLAVAGGPVSAAPAGGDFYQSMLRRGIADYSAGRIEPAARELRVAAFGLVDAIDRYQMAHVYLALASERLGNEADTRYSALRILTAERIERRYASLDLPENVRKAFETAAAKVLTAEQLATLRAPVPPAQLAANSAEASSATPAPQPRAAQPAPSRATTPAPKTRAPKTPAPQPRQQPAVAQTPAPLPPRSADPETPVVKRTATVAEITTAVANADRSLTAGRLAEARAGYASALDRAPADHDLILRIAEGLYRSRDFAGVVRAFQRLGPLRRGEDPYRYYLAVGLFETGQYSAAKRELKAALPYIEETPDVVRYRAKIESAAD